MNIKIIALSAIISTLLMAASPMVSTSMSTDNGGTKLAIDAYSDGGGVLMINQASDTKFDNSSMNKLVFKYGDAAKNSNTTLKNQVNVLSPGVTALEKADATSKLEVAKVVINPPVNGTQCDDGISTTSGDVWQNGVCEGPLVDGVTCDDNNNETSGDKWLAGICSGVDIYATKDIVDVFKDGSIIGFYKFDNGGIDSTGSRNLTLAATSQIAGKFGNALSSTTSSTISMPLLTFSKTLSVSNWVNGEISGGYIGFGRKNGYVGYNGQYWYRIFGGTFQSGRAQIPANGTGLNATTGSSGWNHYVTTLDLNSYTLKAYKNGVMVYNSPMSSNDITAVTSYYNAYGFTDENPSGVSAYPGVDQIRVYNKILSATEVLALSKER